MKNSRFIRTAAFLASTSIALPPLWALDPADMDPTASPCREFVQYADGGWLKRNPIPPSFARWGTFSVLGDQNREALRAVLEEAATGKSPEGSDERKLGDFYS